jgi:hypothetical protein
MVPHIGATFVRNHMLHSFLHQTSHFLISVTKNIELFISKFNNIIRGVRPTLTRSTRSKIRPWPKRFQTTLDLDSPVQISR